MRRKKYLALVIAVAVAAGGVFGVTEAVKRTTSAREIRVYPASDFNYGWYSGSSDLEGIITAEDSQSVYLTGSETVSEVAVSEGDQVHVGDLLLTYDTTQTGITLEMQKLQKEEIGLNIEVAERNLDKLNRTKPVSDEIPSEDFGGGDWGFGDDGPEEPESGMSEPESGGTSSESGAGSTSSEPESGSTSPESGPESVPGKQESRPESESGRNPLLPVEDPGTLQAYRQLDALTKAYNASEKGAGGINHPLKYLCEDGCVILPSFVKMIRDQADGKDLYFILEIREGDMPSGALRAAWVENATLLADQVPEDWRGVLRISSVLPQKEAASGTESVPDPGSQAATGEDAASPAEESASSGSPDGPASTAGSDPQTAADPTAYGSGTGGGSEDSGHDGRSAEASEPTESKEASEKTGSASWENAESADASAVVSAGAALPIQAYAQIKTVTFSGSPVVLALRLAGGDTADEADQTDSQDTASFSGVGLLTGDLVYTKEELDAAKKDMRDQIRDLKLDDREADLKIASAQKAFDAGEVRATMDGIVTKAGDPDNPGNDGTAFLVVAGSEGQYVKGGIPELMRNQIRVGDSVLVTSWQSGAVLTATIRSISDYPDESGQFYQSDGNSSLYPFTAYLEDTSDTFTEGEWVQISLENTDLSDSGDLYLWKAFIREENGQKYVWKRDENGTLKKQEIRTGALSGEGYRILSGVSAEDYLAFPYGKGLKEGAKTKISEASELYG